MNEKKIKLIVIGVILFLIVLAIALVVFGKKSNSPADDTVATGTADKNASITKEVTGTVESVNDESISIIAENGENITLKVPDQKDGKVSIWEESAGENGDHFIKEIGLFDISAEKKILARYNTQTNEYLSLMVANY